MASLPGRNISQNAKTKELYETCKKTNITQKVLITVNVHPNYWQAKSYDSPDSNGHQSQPDVRAWRAILGEHGLQLAVASAAGVGGWIFRFYICFGLLFTIEGSLLVSPFLRNVYMPETSRNPTETVSVECVRVGITKKGSAVCFTCVSTSISDSHKCVPILLIWRFFSFWKLNLTTSKFVIVVFFINIFNLIIYVVYTWLKANVVAVVEFHLDLASLQTAEAAQVQKVLHAHGAPDSLNSKAVW